MQVIAETWKAAKGQQWMLDEFQQTVAFRGGDRYQTCKDLGAATGAQERTKIGATGAKRCSIWTSLGLKNEG